MASFGGLCPLSPEPPSNAYFKIFLNVCPIFREKFFEKWQIPLKLSKNRIFCPKIVNISLLFRKVLKTSPASGRLKPPDPLRGDLLYKPTLGGPRSPPPLEKIPAGDNAICLCFGTRRTFTCDETNPCFPIGPAICAFTLCCPS